MIISFDRLVPMIDKEERLYWLGVLRNIINEYNSKRPLLTNKDFNLWLRDTWKIKILMSDVNILSISGIFIDDASISMLLLKFPHN